MTARRLAELRIGSLIPSNLSNVLEVGGQSPCLILCRARVRRSCRELLRSHLPVLLVRSERDIERVAQVVAFAATQPLPLSRSAVALGRWVR